MTMRVLRGKQSFRFGKCRKTPTQSPKAFSRACYTSQSMTRAEIQSQFVVPRAVWCCIVELPERYKYIEGPWRGKEP